MEMQFVLIGACVSFFGTESSHTVFAVNSVQTVSLLEGTSLKGTGHVEHNVLLMNIRLNLHILKIALKIII
jgi:hypothetical protein